jgi:tetratricopeptide (TPR) repeat protein
MGYASAKLYFNLGNAYYKHGNIPKAILNYERAKLLDPNDDDISFNIELCNQFIVDQIEPLPRPFFVQWYWVIVNINSADEWAVISLIAFVLLLLVALAYFFSPSSVLKKVSFSFGVLFLVVCLSTLGFASQQKKKILQHRSAIIFTPTVTVKGSPDESGTALFVIHEGLKVDVLETVGLWYKIRLIDGNIGWVKKDVLELI